MYSSQSYTSKGGVSNKNVFVTSGRMKRKHLCTQPYRELQRPHICIAVWALGSLHQPLTAATGMKHMAARQAYDSLPLGNIFQTNAAFIAATAQRLHRQLL